MAELKKYMDQAALEALVTQIKAEDGKVLAAAKTHAEGLASNYDAAGAATTAESNAKAYTDKLASGAVKTNTDAIAAIKDDANVDSFADVVAELAKKQNVGDYATKTEAQGYADAKDEAIAAAKKAGDDAQASVDALAGKVGEVPADQTVMGIITNIQENAYDDTEVRGLIGDNADAIAAEKERAEGIEGGLRTDVDTVSGKVTTLIGEDTGKSARTIANEELAKQLIAEGAKESLDTLAEIAAWIQSHPDDASAMNKAIEDLEALVGALPEGVTATTVVGYIAEAVAAEKTRAEGVEGGLDTRLKAVEAKFGEGEGNVESQIATAKSEAISESKTYADGLNTAMNTRVEALEAVDHEHANKALLDTYTQTEANLADAVAKKHEHENAEVLAGISAEKVVAWDAAEQNAKTYADGLNTAMQSTVDGVAGRVTALETASATHALASDLTAAVERIAANETAIANNASAIGAFTAITTDEVNALFA